MRRRVKLILAGLLLLTLSACNLSTEAPEPTPERIVPTVEFIYPTNGSLVIEGTDVQIELLAQDPRGVGVSRVELYVDDVPHQDGAPLVSSAVTVFTVEMNWLAEGWDCMRCPPSPTGLTARQATPRRSACRSWPVTKPALQQTVRRQV